MLVPKIEPKVAVLEQENLFNGTDATSFQGLHAFVTIYRTSMLTEE